MFQNLFATQGLSLDRLRNFHSFADIGSIVGAAPDNPVRQSLISRQIRELGEFFGVELVKRQGRGLVLTDAGRRLASLVREQFGSLNEFARDARKMPATLSIVAPNSIATWLLLPRLREIGRRLPGHRFLVHHEQSAGIVQGVLEGRYDIGLVRETDLPRTLGRRSIGTASFALFVPTSLKFQPKSKNPAAWLQLPLALPVGGNVRASIDRLAQKHGVELSPVLSCDSYIQAAAAVLSGAVASVLPQIAAATLVSRTVEMWPISDLAQKPFKTFLIWSKRGVATRTSVAEAVEALPDVLAGD